MPAVFQSLSFHLNSLLYFFAVYRYFVIFSFSFYVHKNFKKFIYLGILYKFFKYAYITKREVQKLNAKSRFKSADVDGAVFLFWRWKSFSTILLFVDYVAKKMIVEHCYIPVKKIIKTYVKSLIHIYPSRYSTFVICDCIDFDSGINMADFFVHKKHFHVFNAYNSSYKTVQYFVINRIISWFVTIWPS